MFVIRDAYDFAKTGQDGKQFETREAAVDYLKNHGFKYDSINDNGRWMTYKSTAGGWAQLALYVEIAEE